MSRARCRTLRRDTWFSFCWFHGLLEHIPSGASHPRPGQPPSCLLVFLFLSLSACFLAVHVPCEQVQTLPLLLPYDNWSCMCYVLCLTREVGFSQILSLSWAWWRHF